MLEIPPPNLTSEDLQSEEAYNAQLLLQLCPLIDEYTYGNFGSGHKVEAPAPVQVFFLPDEVGSRIKRVHEAENTAVNCRMAVLVYLPTGQPFSFVWPTKSIAEGTALCRPYYCCTPSSAYKSTSTANAAHLETTCARLFREQLADMGLTVDASTGANRENSNIVGETDNSSGKPSADNLQEIVICVGVMAINAR